MTITGPGPSTYDEHNNLPAVPSVQLDNPETPVPDGTGVQSPSNLWDTLATSLGTVHEQPNVDGAGNPALPGEHQAANISHDVKQPGSPGAPVIVVHHVMETVERAAQEARPRTVMMDTNGAGTTHAVPTILLDQNPNRRRALIKVLGTTQTVIVAKRGAGGNATMGAGVANGGMGYQLATGDAPLEVKDQAAFEGYLVTAGPCPVSIWEELNATSTGQDLSAGGVVSTQ